MGYSITESRSQCFLYPVKADKLAVIHQLTLMTGKIQQPQCFFFYFYSYLTYETEEPAKDADFKLGRYAKAESSM